MNEAIQIIFIPICKLSLLENNPRKIDKQQFEKLCLNITNDPDFFTDRPCLVNHITDSGKMVVYAGNQRLRAAKKLGWKEVPCLVRENLTDEMMKDRVILDNMSFGSFDWDELGNSWDPIKLLELGFTEKDLHLDLDEGEAKEKKKKLKCCPNCGHEF